MGVGRIAIGEETAESAVVIVSKLELVCAKLGVHEERENIEEM